MTKLKLKLDELIQVLPFLPNDEIKNQLYSINTNEERVELIHRCAGIFIQPEFKYTLRNINLSINLKLKLILDLNHPELIPAFRLDNMSYEDCFRLNSKYPEYIKDICEDSSFGLIRPVTIGSDFKRDSESVLQLIKLNPEFINKLYLNYSRKSSILSLLNMPGDIFSYFKPQMRDRRIKLSPTVDKLALDHPALIKVMCIINMSYGLLCSLLDKHPEEFFNHTSTTILVDDDYMLELLNKDKRFFTILRLYRLCDKDLKSALDKNPDILTIPEEKFLGQNYKRIQEVLSLNI